MNQSRIGSEGASEASDEGLKPACISDQLFSEGSVSLGTESGRAALIAK